MVSNHQVVEGQTSRSISVSDWLILISDTSGFHWEILFHKKLIHHQSQSIQFLQFLCNLNLQSLWTQHFFKNYQ